MSMTMERPTSTWEARPGWGIAVDLTPREVVQARQVKVHKRLIALGLVLVLAVCAGLALITFDSRSSAEEAESAAELQTTQLTAETNKYSVLTTMQRVIDQVQTQVATLMADDVDFVNLMARIRTALPKELTLDNASVVLTAPVPAAGGTVVTGPQTIGTVSLAGTAGRIRDVTPFVAALNQLRGVVNVVPQSVSKTEDGVTFTFTMNITDELYTHRFDVTDAGTTGGAP
jgi:Tfp pilus assembly protein PilN